MIRTATSPVPDHRQTSISMHDDFGGPKHQSQSPDRPAFDPRKYTNEDMDRLERWQMIQERAARATRVGNTYGDAEVSGEATLYRGNVLSSPEAGLIAATHNYGKIKVSKHARAVDGNVLIPQNMELPTRRGQDNHHGGWYPAR